MKIKFKIFLLFWLILTFSLRVFGAENISKDKDYDYLKFLGDTIEKIKSDLGKKDLEKKKQAKQVYEKINGKEYSVKKLSTENKELYGSVKPTEISKTILGIEKLNIKPSMIQLTKEIKSLGTFKVKVIFHSEIEAEVNIKIVAAETIQ